MSSLDFSIIRSIHAASAHMDTVEIDVITRTLLHYIRNRLDDATNIAKAAEVCAESGNIVAAVRILMSAEDPVHLADRMLQATLLLRRELSNAFLD